MDRIDMQDKEETNIETIVRDKIGTSDNDTLIVNLINIDKELELKFSNYLLTFNDSNLSICCEDFLYNPIMDFDSVNIGKKKIVDSSIELTHGIKVGMDKHILLDKFFIYSDEIGSKLNQIAVCEDERGELYTKYKFVDGKLTEIEFESLTEK